MWSRERARPGSWQRRVPNLLRDLVRLLLVAQRARRVEPARVGHDLGLLLQETLDLRAEVGQLDPRGRQGVVQVLADLGGLSSRAVHGLHVVLVLGLLLVPAAVVDDENEDDREQDRACNEQGQPDERG